MQMIRDLGTEDEIFNYVFEDSEFINKLVEGLDPEKCKSISYQVTIMVLLKVRVVKEHSILKQWFARSWVDLI